jgi:hypothetical protein
LRNAKPLQNLYNAAKELEDDGYSKQKSFFEKFIVNQFKGQSSTGTLILVRHGESDWNREKKFTGWVDADLSQHGVREIEHAARLLLERGYKIDITYTSLLKRAIRSSWILLR